MTLRSPAIAALAVLFVMVGAAFVLTSEAGVNTNVQNAIPTATPLPDPSAANWQETQPGSDQYQYIGNTQNTVLLTVQYSNFDEFLAANALAAPADDAEAPLLDIMTELNDDIQQSVIESGLELAPDMAIGPLVEPIAGVPVTLVRLTVPAQTSAGGQPFPGAELILAWVVQDGQLARAEVQYQGVSEPMVYLDFRAWLEDNITRIVEQAQAAADEAAAAADDAANDTVPQSDAPSTPPESSIDTEEPDAAADTPPEGETSAGDAATDAPAGDETPANDADTAAPADDAGDAAPADDASAEDADAAAPAEGDAGDEAPAADAGDEAPADDTAAPADEAPAANDAGDDDTSAAPVEPTGPWVEITPGIYHYATLPDNTLLGIDPFSLEELAVGIGYTPAEGVAITASDIMAFQAELIQTQFDAANGQFEPGPLVGPTETEVEGVPLITMSFTITVSDGVTSNNQYTYLALIPIGDTHVNAITLQYIYEGDPDQQIFDDYDAWLSENIAELAILPEDAAIPADDTATTEDDGAADDSVSEENASTEDAPAEDAAPADEAPADDAGDTEASGGE